MGAPSLLFLCTSWCLLTGFYRKPCSRRCQASSQAWGFGATVQRPTASAMLCPVENTTIGSQGTAAAPPPSLGPSLQE